MTKLLVSVRDPQEALLACRHGADVIDVKEPNRGSLGAASPEMIGQVAETVRGELPLSVALGELLEVGNLPCEMNSALFAARYAKIGLAGCATCDDWPQRWQTWSQQLPQEVAPIIVAYADWQSAMAPPPQQVLRQGIALGCGGLLIDTYGKRAGALVDLLSVDQLASLTERAQAAGLIVALAGSLQEMHLSAVLEFEPDLIAVRGAVCVGGRAGRVDGQRVARLARNLAQAAINRSSV